MKEKFSKNSEISDRIRQVIDYLGVTVKEFSENLGFNRPQSIYDYLNGRVKPSFDFFSNFQNSAYSESVDLAWLVSGKGQMARDQGSLPKVEIIDTESGEDSSVEAIIKEQLLAAFQEMHIYASANASPEVLAAKQSAVQRLKDVYYSVKLDRAEKSLVVGDAVGLEGEIIKIEDGTEFRHFGDEKYLVVTPFIDRFAYDRYVLEWSSRQYIDELPKYAIVVDKLQFGVYRSFVLVDNAMDNGLKGSLCKGSVVTARRVDQKYWRSKLDPHKFQDFIIHSNRGLLVRRISSHDLDEGVLTCLSLSADKDLYPDFSINLPDIKEIYAIAYVTNEWS
ncbi:helix-turn-helix transcriptional regulator [Dyadobacter sp. CY351]|uniref:helix-turn-helix domain-containing protein n=1 Tax=Dyadobacter sp. CY351 TaxID=2909337 RepID=UPI001F26D1DD|nr:helix-turn-helix transcriptional regulator [Dyadobacter sp. CY351]